MIRLVAQAGTIKSTRTDLLIYFLFEDAEAFRVQLTTLQKLIGEEILPSKEWPFSGKERETLLLFPKKLRSPRLLLVGAGKAGEWSAERLRRAAAHAAKTAQAFNVENAAILEPDPTRIVSLAPSSPLEASEIYGCALAEGIMLGLYKFDRYLTQERASVKPLKRIYLVSESPTRRRQIARGAARAKVICEATCFARDLSNAPGSEIYPESLAAAARTSGRRHGFAVNVYDEHRLMKLRMGGLLGVSAGSARRPRLIFMQYKGARKSTRPVVLVGKGVTFDSGGISIKPAANMAEMKMDMAGGAAVIATLQAAAALQLPVNLIGLVPATENLPGSAALKPGDILRHYNGMTSEVDNTDAEGRLILADALSYASRFTPEVIIDLATLTGAVVVALGHVATGMMGNDSETMHALKEAGERTYERVWELPMYQEYESLIKSDVADVKNVGGRWAGAITAAMFLKKFVGTTRWVHLDIAGTAITEEAADYIPRGGSGVGVRLLIDYLRHRSIG